MVICRPPCLHARRLARGRSHIAAISFLVGATLLLVIVCHWYLLPALAVFNVASLHDKKRLAAYSLLLLVVILFCLGVMLLLALRIGRRLFPPPSGPPAKTEYPDAWIEAGKRLTDKFDDE